MSSEYVPEPAGLLSQQEVAVEAKIVYWNWKPHSLLMGPGTDLHTAVRIKENHKQQAEPEGMGGEQEQCWEVSLTIQIQTKYKIQQLYIYSF